MPAAGRPHRAAPPPQDGRPRLPRQRIIVQQHVNGLARDELEPYLAHRLHLAGCELPLFEPPAIEALFQTSRGLPLEVNRLAHLAHTGAALAQTRSVSGEHLEQACAELQR